METKNSEPVNKLTGEQIIQKKLDEANVMLRKLDLSKLPNRWPENKA